MSARVVLALVTVEYALAQRDSRVSTVNAPLLVTVRMDHAHVAYASATVDSMETDVN